MWNAFPAIRKHLLRAGYEDCLNRGTGRRFPPHINAAQLRNSSSQLMLMPTYWRDGAVDWRELHITADRRINRMWGMAHLSKKRSLVGTLNDHFGLAACPFLPPSYTWKELMSLPDWKERLARAPRWMLKSNEHRGQVQSRLIISASSP